VVIFINEFATQLVYPDVTFYLEIDEKTFEIRRKEKRDRIELENIDFIKKVMQGYSEIASSKRFVKIDARSDQNQIFRAIIKEIERRFNL
jgi:dTMP kinase